MTAQMTAEARALMSVQDWRARAYRDPDATPEAIDLRDPVDRLAAFMYGYTFNTPEQAHGNVTSAAVKGEGAIVATWARLEPVARQLWRRRAALAIDLALSGGAS